MRLTIENFKKNTTDTTNYLTHIFHAYPAKFIPQIPKLFIEKYTKPGDTVYDPFVGSGTTLVECKLLNRNGIGIDSNPIATLISICKTTKLSSDEIIIANNFLLDIEAILALRPSNFHLQYDYLNTIDFQNKEHWFQNNVQIELSFLIKKIREIKNEKIVRFFEVCLSSIIVDVSNQESNTRYAYKEKSIQNFKTLNQFVKRGKMMIERISDFSNICSDSKIEIYTQSSEDVSFIPNESVALVITSPPYANTYDYYLYHKSRMNWLGYDVRKTQETEIGSRDKHSSKKLEINHFLKGLEKCFKECERALISGGYAVIIIGDSVIRGELFDAKLFTKDLFAKFGMDLIEFSSQNLKETTRMFNPKFTNELKLEHILVFKKN